MLKKRYIFFAFFVCLALFAWASNDAPSYLNYIKNNGQWNAKVLYQADFRGGRLFMERNAVTYLFYPKDGLTRLHPHHQTNQTLQTGRNSDGITLDFHAVRMEFVGSSANPTTEQVNKKSFYHNYYLGKDATKWASKVPISEGINYGNLYNNISLKAFSSGNNFRYDFLVNPLADASVIKLKFTGQDKLSLKEGKLIIGTSVGDIEQQAPYAYQEIDGIQHKVDCQYVLKENIVTIEVTGKYNHNAPLVIDPTLVFATFTGSVADNWGMSASYDNQGNGYTAGIGFDVGYPTTPGAFQTSWAGGGTGGGNTSWPSPDDKGFDIVTSKFDATGSNLLFSTYLGGSDNEEPESIIVDNSNNLLILGRSYSSNFPVTAGAYDISSNGGADIIVTKFNSTGTSLIGSTYVGGSSDDAVNYSSIENILGSLKYNYADDGRGDIIIDTLDNVYIASCTQSTNFPVTAGCLQSSNNGVQDGCIFKLNANLTSLVWSTYLGGNANDAAYNLALDNANSVYVTGGTESTNFKTTSGALHPTYMGNIDGFLTHLSANGSSILQSTYIGTSGYDQSYFVQLDVSSNVYIYGQTSGAYPITAGVYSNPNSGQFIHEFNSTLSNTIFSTEFGTTKGTPDIAPSAFLVDKCGNIYISGWGGDLYGYNNSTSSTSGMPISSNAFQHATDGSDFYFMVLQPNATALWYATYFGGNLGSQEHVDGGTSRFDKSGVIYQAICEGCGSLSDMPTTPSAWSTSNNSTNCNNALVKFSFDLQHASAALSINPTSATGCAPFNVSFTNQSQNATQFVWSFGDGTTATTVNTSHTYTAVGTYSVSLAATNIGACYSTDTILAIITVTAPPLITVNTATVCAGSAANLTASGGISYSWNTGATGASITPSPTITTQYTVSSTIGGCTSTATTVVNTLSLPTLSVTNVSICPGNAGTISVNGASSYSWSTGDTTSFIIKSPSTTTHYTVTGTDANSCKNKAVATITVNPLPVITVNSPSICIGNTGTLTASGANTYTWSTNDTTSSIIQAPLVTSNYTVMGTNLAGCVSSKTSTITVNPLPVISVNKDTICAGTNATLLATGASTYVWNTGSNGAVFTPFPAVTTNYTVTGTDIHNCANTATTSVYVNVSPTLTVNSTSVCKGDTATLTASGASTYTWSTGNTTATIIPSPISTTVYTVSGSNGICTSSKTSTVSVLVNNTHISTNGALGVCTGSSITLSTTAPYLTYLWSNGQQTPSIHVYHAGNYAVHTVDINGCKGLDSIKIFEDSPVAIPLQDTTICSGNAVQLHVTQGNYTYLWTPSFGLNNATIYNPIAHPTSTTVYMVSVTNGVCVNTNTVSIFVNPSPQITVKPKYSVVTQGESVLIHAQSNDSCYWYPSDYLNCTACNTVLCIPDADITYTISATNDLGCTTYTTAIVHVEIESTFYIPNTFTPNSDGMNEIFKPLATHIHDYKIDIFDRWGLLIFESTNLDQGWDGTYKGGKCQEDVYVYKVDYTNDSDNRSHTKAGQVNLIR